MEGDASCTAVSWRRNNASDITVTWFARTATAPGGTGWSYAFNDWRSNAFGANDHEADWEKIFIYLSESESGGTPREAGRTPRTRRPATTSGAGGTIRSWRRSASTP